MVVHADKMAINEKIMCTCLCNKMELSIFRIPNVMKICETSERNCIICQKEGKALCGHGFEMERIYREVIFLEVRKTVISIKEEIETAVLQKPDT